jgi:hypothetical protein
MICYNLSWIICLELKESVVEITTMIYIDMREEPLVNKIIENVY